MFTSRGVIVQIIHSLLGVAFCELWFRHLGLHTQLGVPQLLKDVVSNNCNECHKCYDSSGVLNYWPISSRVVDMVGGTN